MTLYYNQFGLNGRLGNQMFQFAFMLDRAKTLNTKAFLPKRTSENSYESTNDICEFSLENDYVFIGEGCTPNQKHISLSESKFSFDSNLMNVVEDKDIFYHGYFQSEKYFLNQRKEILKCFSLKKESNVFSFYKEKIDKTNSVSVHMRFGDYLNLSNYHTNLGKTMYYYDCLTSISNLSSKTVFVFSDDIAKAKEWFNTYMEELESVVYVEGNITSVETLILQSLCDINIIANSSFSWWAAWLNQKEHKIVYAPKQWFGPDGPKDTQDIYCEGWIKK